MPGSSPMHGPRSLARIPEPVEQFIFARSIHALPETLMTEGYHLAVADSREHGFVFEYKVRRIMKICGNEIAVYDHVAAVDIAIRLGGFLLESRHAVVGNIHCAESAQWMNRRAGEPAAVGTMEREKFRDIDIGQPVAVGQKEFAVGVKQIFGSAKDTASGHGIESGSRQSHLPVIGIGFSMIYDPRFMSEFDRDIGRADMIVDEKIDEFLFFISETQDEAFASESGEAPHDMPQNRLFADRDHRFGQKFRHFR